jgi:hypothetical protein
MNGQRPLKKTNALAYCKIVRNVIVQKYVWYIAHKLALEKYELAISQSYKRSSLLLQNLNCDCQKKIYGVYHIRVKLLKNIGLWVNRHWYLKVTNALAYCFKMFIVIIPQNIYSMRQIWLLTLR